VRTVPDWDLYYLEICRVVARRSKDPATQIGCVIAGPAHEIRSTGYNSFPRGIADHKPERAQRPEKYLWIEHAERNAIYNAARAGTPLEGCTIFVELMPCMDCARAIVQAGIVEVVVDSSRMQRYSSEFYNQHFELARTLLEEAGVVLRFAAGEAGESRSAAAGDGREET
jgi:dCMP deaminase